jgi:hypothetical protein
VSWFNRKQARPAPQGPRCVIRLVEYVDQESGVKHWDVLKRYRCEYGLQSTISMTDDYGYKTYSEALAAYQRYLAIERGEIKVGYAKYTVAEAHIP